ncbi:SIMPL domain-containing protein [Microbulbifer hainanensis]|uniref:SIMPL domain-containing protein n=1 Tax=Microbulbifer hainanensis TaxID=2735675 RepID=UPI001865D547|nr:SIMPL domain-containing protein [Microbulbifer hainanensis]
MRSIIACLILIFSPFATVCANSLPDFPFVVATGTAKEDVKPDNATVHINVTAFSDSSETALQQVNTATDKIVALTQKLKIPKEKLEAHDLEKSTKRRRDEDHRALEILGYEIERTFQIHLEGLDQYAELMNGLVAIDNISSMGTQFDVQQRKAIEERLTRKASENARHRAELMADSLGVKVKSVYAVSQDSGFDYMFRGIGADSPRYAMLASPGPAGNVAMFVPESIQVAQQINVVFRLTQ